MTTLAELCEQPPAATRGVATGFTYGAGTWRHVIEIADPSVGSAVQWYDITAIDGAFTGYEYQRGSDTYQGRYRASVVTLDLYASDDRFAPWNDDTSATFGTHVELGPGLLIRSGFIRVDGGVVVEWNPRFTNKIESWFDASYSRGKVRQHRIVARDLMSSVVGVPLPARPEENWSDRMFHWLVNSGWSYGSLIYGAQFLPGAVPVLTLPARPAVTSALNELDTICDPCGLVWYTDRYGHLVMRPRTDDTFHADAFAAGATGDEYVAPEPVSFAWWACEDEEPGDTPTEIAAYAVDTPGVDPFGIDKTERYVLNHVKITSPTTPFDDDDPISIQRYDRHTLQANWVAENDVVAAAILSSRAFADREARPVTTSVDLRNFHPGPARLDFLDYMGIQHRNSDEGLTCFANGWLRSYRERVRPRGCDTAWELSITFDVYASSSEASMLPVFALAVTAVTDTSASFSWYNPAQSIEPTHTQIRLLDPSSMWATVGYAGAGGPIEASWSGLSPLTDYEFQVRLVRIVDGIVTHFSPSRVVNFRTATTTVPDVDPGDGDVDFPPPGEGCYLEWRLQSTADGDTWTTIDTGEDHAPPWELSYDFGSLDDTLSYRFCTREICPGGPTEWECSTNTALACLGETRLDVPPYSDAALVAYFPHVCPDHIAEAVSGEPVTLGPSFDGWHLVSSVPVLDSAAAGLIAYGSQPLPAVDFAAPLSIACRARIATQPGVERRLFGYGGLSISIVNDGAGFAVKGNATEIGPTVTTISGSSVFPLAATYDFALTHDPTAGDLILYVNAAEEADALGIVGDRHNFGLYEINAPASSWITDCAVWDRVLDASELPGYVAPPVAVTINQGAGQSDPATASPILFTAVFAQAMTGFVGTDVALSGTAGPTVAAVSSVDGITYTIAVSGMTASGTVIASIPAGVCVSVVGGTANAASTSTDNTVTYSLFALPPAIMALSPAGYWKLNETGGTTANDSSGNARHGTYNGPALAATVGPDTAGYANFDGSNDGVTIADNNVWSINNSGAGFTMWMLARPETFNGGFLMGKELDSTNTEYVDQIGSGAGTVGASSRRAGLNTVASASTTTSPLLANQWNAIGIVWTNANTPPAIYVNGPLRTVSTTAPGGVYANTTAPLELGGLGRLPSTFRYDGALAHVATFPVALNATQMDTLMAAAYQDGWFSPLPVVTDRGGFDTISYAATSVLTFPSSLAYAAGDMHVVIVACDNSIAGGGTSPISSVTDAKGNTYVMQRREIVNPSATANIGQVVEVWTSIISTALVAADVITVSFSTVTQSKAALCKRIVRGYPSTSTLQPHASFGAVSPSTNTITVTTTALKAGDVVIGALGREDRNGTNGDSDSLDGSWSSFEVRATASGAPDQNGTCIGSQHKVVTGTSAQSWTAGDVSRIRHNAAAVLVVRQV